MQHGHRSVQPGWWCRTFLVWVDQEAMPLRDCSVVPYAPEQTTKEFTLSGNFLFLFSSGLNSPVGSSRETK